MIEIKCTEKQKDALNNAIITSYCCPIGVDECNKYGTCFICIEKNIKWTIRGNEDAE